MKYKAEILVKKIINLTIDADNEETAFEVADEEMSRAYDVDTYYEIQSVTRLEDENAY